MKIQCISDTHGSYFVDKVEECDILLMAGDISPVQGDHSYAAQRAWFMHDFVNNHLIELQEKAKHIVFVGGNHDTYLYDVNMSDGNSDRINEQLPDNVHYLCDEQVEIDGIKIYGTPWCVLPSWARKGPPVWNFARSNEELADIYAKIPDGMDFVLSHSPAYGYCDAITDLSVMRHVKDVFGDQPEHLGSKALKVKMFNMQKPPKYLISGHIHSAERVFIDYTNISVKFACVSILDESYQFSDEQPPLIIYTA